MRASSRLALPMRKAEDVIPFLGKATHWKQGRSAKALADCWFNAAAIPPAVSNVLSQSECLAKAELLEAWLERQTDLGDGRSTPSQTDLLALIGAGEKLGVLGIEAKVDESFGKLLAEWLADGSAGKVRRLDGLCKLLNLDPATVGNIRYQLLHRTAAVVLEARRFRSKIAVLVVQSFCPQSTGLRDCAAFCKMLGLPGLQENQLLGPLDIGGVQLWIGWASDTVMRATDSIETRVVQ